MSFFRHRKAPLVPMHQALALCDVSRARRIDPPVRIDRQPLSDALARWNGRILDRKPNRLTWY